jgi:hypothetical protein
MDGRPGDDAQAGWAWLEHLGDADVGVRGGGCDWRTAVG